MAPVGVLGLCAQDGHGDLATARAAARTGVPMVASTFSVDPLEQVAGEFGGVDGIYCSNHGERQANGGLAALDALPEVVEAADSLPVLFDSGIRSGADVVKALALSATAVGVGRPYVYGLALEGTNGIIHVLRALLAEADLIMGGGRLPNYKRTFRRTARCAASHSHWPDRPLELRVRLITRLPWTHRGPALG